MTASRIASHHTIPVPVSPTDRQDVQRRRREVALTARWLRDLRGVAAAQSATPSRPSPRFTRAVER